MKISSGMAGIAGEYFVAAELSRRGFIASISLKNTQGVDIIATGESAERSVTIQCKTTRSKGKSWMLDKKSEKFYSQTHFYVFISLGEELPALPQFHIVPSEIVAKAITERHAKWISRKKRDGSDRMDNRLRVFEDKEGRYLGKWDSLGLGAITIELEPETTC